MPSFFEQADFDEHESVTFATDRRTKMRAIIAVHSTHLGPSAGGVRMFPYADSESAIKDVLRLSRGMSYKNAMAGLKLGGGKAVLIGNPRTDKTPELMYSLGNAIENLGGKYLAAEDVGMTLADMENIAKKTNHVFGRDPKLGFGGEPSPMTALGVFLSIEKAIEVKLGRKDLNGLKVAVQGAGAVGADLCRRLSQAGAKIFVCDTDKGRVAHAASISNGEIVDIDEIIGLDVDVFAPCAMGAIINDASIPNIKAPIICGAANNQLAEEKHGAELVKRDILYCPDYVVNAGGIINVAYEVGGNYSKEAVEKHVSQIPNTLENVLKEAISRNVSPAIVADEQAKRLIGR